MNSDQERSSQVKWGVNSSSLSLGQVNWVQVKLSEFKSSYLSSSQVNRVQVKLIEFKSS